MKIKRKRKERKNEDKGQKEKIRKTGK